MKISCFHFSYVFHYSYVFHWRHLMHLCISWRYHVSIYIYSCEYVQLCMNACEHIQYVQAEHIVSFRNSGEEDVERDTRIIAKSIHYVFMWLTTTYECTQTYNILHLIVYEHPICLYEYTWMYVNIWMQVSGEFMFMHVWMYVRTNVCLYINVCHACVSTYECMSKHMNVCLYMNICHECMSTYECLSKHISVSLYMDVCRQTQYTQAVSLWNSNDENYFEEG